MQQAVEQRKTISVKRESMRLDFVSRDLEKNERNFKKRFYSSVTLEETRKFNIKL